MTPSSSVLRPSRARALIWLAFAFCALSLVAIDVSQLLGKPQAAAWPKLGAILCGCIVFMLFLANAVFSWPPTNTLIKNSTWSPFQSPEVRDICASDAGGEG